MVVDDGDGGLVLALQEAQPAEQSGDFGGAIFIDAVEAHQGVEQDEGRSELGEGGVETGLVLSRVEAQAGGEVTTKRSRVWS
jgi:hypothetical protein